MLSVIANAKAQANLIGNLCSFSNFCVLLRNLLLTKEEESWNTKKGAFKN
jgi:hypothetical protein